MMKKTPRCIQIFVAHYANDDYNARTITQRAPVGELWANEKNVTVHTYYAKNKLRMLRCLQLQSAFLAKGGALL